MLFRDFLFNQPSIRIIFVHDHNDGSSDSITGVVNRLFTSAQRPKLIPIALDGGMAVNDTALSLLDLTI